MRRLLPTLACILALTGCATLPPESEAARLRDSLIRFTDLYTQIGNEQLADATKRITADNAALADADPANDALAKADLANAIKQKNKAEKVIQVATIVGGVLTDPAAALAKLVALKADPYVSALVVFVISEIESYQKATAAAAVTAPPTPPTP